MKSILVIIIIFCIAPIVIIAQSGSIKGKHQNYSFLSVNYHSGDILATNDFVKGENLSGKPLESYQSIAIKFGFQNPGYTNWQKIYRGPYYGLGVYMVDFGNKVEMGNPKAAFGFFGIPVKRFNKLEIYTEMQLGVAWDWKHYDPLMNPSNVAIGSPLTLYLDVSLQASYHISKNLDLGLGVGFTHFSNGGFERPNRGLNLFAPSIELKYHFKERPDVRSIERAPKRMGKSNDLYFMLGYGDHQIAEHEFDTNYYSVAGLGIYYSIQHGNAFRSGLGIDFNYLRSLSANPDGTPGTQGTMDNLTIGFVYAPELIIGKLSIVGGMGIYAKHHQYGNFNQLYQRAGVKYHITENFSAGMNVRAINFMLAEFLEFNVGYRIKWRR